LVLNGDAETGQFRPSFSFVTADFDTATKLTVPDVWLLLRVMFANCTTFCRSADEASLVEA
jgi:hypothetical protein